jgi:predicted nicotinamide N-methyase
VRRGNLERLFFEFDETTSKMSRTVTLQIPDDAEEGDLLTFIVDGQELEIKIPIGSQVGDILEIQVGDNERQDDDVNEMVTWVDLGDGVMLELNSEIPDDVGTKKDDADSCDGTHALPWAAGFEIVRRLHDIDFDVTPKRVLELGSGLGLVGMALSLLKLGRQSSTILTDVHSAMPLLLYNIERNKDILTGQSIHAQPLQWSVSDSPLNEEQYDCILGSDLLYNTQMIPSLVSTVKRHLHSTKGIVVMAVRWRKPELERVFFHGTGLHWTLLPSSSCQLSWEDWGNPNVEASNLYFQQTLISVQGTQKPLADITEEETKLLSTTEFEAWEQAHIQIYTGKKLKS